MFQYPVKIPNLSPSRGKLPVTKKIRVSGNENPLSRPFTSRVNANAVVKIPLDLLFLEYNTPNPARNPSPRFYSNTPPYRLKITEQLLSLLSEYILIPRTPGIATHPSFFRI